MTIQMTRHVGSNGVRGNACTFLSPDQRVTGGWGGVVGSPRRGTGVIARWRCESLIYLPLVGTQPSLPTRALSRGVFQIARVNVYIYIKANLATDYIASLNSHLFPSNIFPSCESRVSYRTRVRLAYM